MAIKLIAVGNSIMEDDGIALTVAREIEDKLIKLGIEIVIGETDVEYTMSQINEDDNLIILDSTMYGNIPGTVIEMPLRSIDVSKMDSLSQHKHNIIRELKFNKLSIQGIFIGVEVYSIDFSFEISEPLRLQLGNICHKVLQIIILYKSEIYTKG